MSLLLSGSDGLSDVDGTAATPAIRGTDANTGIFFPAADTIAFSEGGVESMRIDASGNVGIGTSSPSARVHASGSGAGFKHTNGSVAVDLYSDGSNGLYEVNGACFVRTTNANPIVFGTNNAERLRIASSGNVGIGTTSPAVKLDVIGGAYIDNITGGKQNGGGNFHLDSTGAGTCYLNYFGGTGGVFVGNGVATGVGPITASAFNVSDRNEKENIEYFNTGLSEVMQLKPAKFDLINGEKGLKGFIAQDVQEVMPEAVGKIRKPDSERDTLTLSNTALFPYLVAAIQEQQALITQLQADVAALKEAK